MKLDRKVLSDHISTAISGNREALLRQFSESRPGIGYFFLDGLLPEAIAMEIYKAFPKPEAMVLKNSMREKKYIGVQMDMYDPLLEEIIYAFQEEKVIRVIEEICGVEKAIPDENLYAGGISMMGKGHYLNPHLDNSHDKDRNYWRILNLLYYVTPDWKPENGGNLELWPEGFEQEQITITSRFNRLAVMATHTRSLHSVSPVVSEGFRCCVSNYYFSEKPLLETDTFHVTSFRGRPGNKLSDTILRVDAWLRMGLRKVFKKGIKENPHVYKKDK